MKTGDATGEAPWGVNSEYGVLRDVLLGPPDHFHWLPTSSISKATLQSGARFDHALALRQHAEMVNAGSVAREWANRGTAVLAG